MLPEVREAMLPFIQEEYGNPLSRHFLGEKPRQALEEAREKVALLLHASPAEIVFTSCGSESNNLAVKGALEALPGKKHLITTPIEHHSVLHPAKRLARRGYEVSFLEVDREGTVAPEQVASRIRKDTSLVSVTSASNEIGTLEPIAAIGRICRERGVLFHTDAVAAAGLLELDVAELNVDLLSLSGNVLYGPPGTGALYVRKGVKLIPRIEGGIQENGLRAGAPNTAALVGLGAAADAAATGRERRVSHLAELREKLIEGVLKRIPDVFLTGHRTRRLPNHASFCVKYIEGESITLHLDFLGVAATSGSTCSSAALKGSHVLEAIGVDRVWAQGSIAFSLGIDNTAGDVDHFLREFPGVVERLRAMSPLKENGRS